MVVGASLLLAIVAALLTDPIDWFNRRAALSQVDLTTAEPIMWEYEVRRRWTPAEAELRRMEAEIHDHPLHPERVILETYRRRDAGEDHIQHFVLYWDNPRTWRFCIDDSFRPGDFLDRALNGRTAWSLSASQLNVFQSDGPFPAGMDVSSAVDEIRTQTRLLMFGGAHVAAQLGLIARQIEGGRSPLIEAFAPGVATLRFRLRAAGDDWEIESMDFVDVAAAPTETGRRYAFERWVDAPPLVCRVSAGYREYAPDGKLENEVRSGEICVLPAADFERATRTPDPDRADLLRGSLRVQTIYDYSGSVPVVHAVVPAEVARTSSDDQDARSGGAKSPPSHLISVPLGQASRIVREKRLNQIAWIGAGGVTILVAGIWVRTRIAKVRVQKH